MIHLPVTQNKPAYNHLDLRVHMLRAKNKLGAQGERSAVFLSVCGNMLQRMRRDIGVYLNSAGCLAFLWVLNGRSASSLELDSELCHSEHVTWHFQDEHATRRSMHTWRAHMSLPGKGYCFWEIPLGVSFDCPLLVNDASRTPTPPHPSPFSHACDVYINTRKAEEETGGWLFLGMPLTLNLTELSAASLSVFDNQRVCWCSSQNRKSIHSNACNRYSQRAKG